MLDNFLPKQRHVVGAPLQYQDGMGGGGKLANDLLGIMKSITPMVQDRHRLKTAEQEEVGQRIAIDKKLELQKVLSELNQAAIADPRGFNYEGAIQGINTMVPSVLADIKEKFGEDSKVYKVFEKHYLPQATTMQIGASEAFFKTLHKVSNEIVVENTEEMLINASGLAPEDLKALQNSYINSGGNVDRFQAIVASELLGNFTESAFDPTLIFNQDGTINGSERAKWFNHYFGSMAMMDKDGKVKAASEEFSNREVARLVKAFNTSVGSISQKQERNEEFRTALARTKNNLKSYSLSGDPKNDFLVLDEVANRLGEMVFSSPSPSKEDLTVYRNFLNELVVMKDQMQEAYNINSSLKRAKEFYERGGDTGNADVNRMVRQLEGNINSALVDAIANPEMKPAQESYVLQVIDKEQATGQNNKALKAYFDSVYEVTNPEQLKIMLDAMTLYKKHQGAQSITNDPAYSEKAIKAFNDKYESDPIGALTDYIQQRQKVSLDPTNEARQMFSTLMKASNKEKLLAGAGRVENFFNWGDIALSERITTSFTDISSELINFIVDNNLYRGTKVDDIDAIQDLLRSLQANKWSSGGISSVATLNLLSMDEESKTVVMTPVDLDNVIKYIKSGEIEGLGLDNLKQLKEKDITLDYNYDVASNEVYYNVYVGSGGVFRLDAEAMEAVNDYIRKHNFKDTIKTPPTHIGGTPIW